MPRVSDNNTTAAMNLAIGRAKTRLEDLQLKGGTLKRLTKPSDDPVSNVQAMMITSENVDNKQYQRNIIHAMTTLNITDNALDQLIDIMNKAKEIAIAQSSDFYDKSIRENVSNEVIQLRNATLAIGNKRIGNKYLFSGHKTLTRSFTPNGTYNGDDGHVNLEISKDFFVPINLSGSEVFYGDSTVSNSREHPLRDFPALNNPPDYQYNKGEKKHSDDDGVVKVGRELASLERIPELDDNGNEISLEEDLNVNVKKPTRRSNMFSLLTSLISALENDDSRHIQDLLEKFDSSISRLITLRTRVGSISNSVLRSRSTLENDLISNKARKSELIDADIAELFSNITRQQDVLKTTYQASKSLLNQNLLDFIR